MKNTELSSESKRIINNYPIILIGYGISGKVPKQINLYRILNLVTEHKNDLPDYYPDLADQVCFYKGDDYSLLEDVLNEYSSLDFLKVWENGQEIKVR
ncbi:hypothetical protein NIES2100_04920 [Calothrix sp. NIES-2100]|uniref:hypothetical protein n=1 Tax=Calothrix sp. NIES-2100 TaxID=1954172 RepID=UPI000B618D54|nr:hypothetical protein NIES2100_04920 [Calothrix sp. NIES-2100]